MNRKKTTIRLCVLVMVTLAVAPLVLAQPSRTKDCPPGSHFDQATGRCRRDVPLTPSPPRFLLPPSGVIVLKPGGVREQANECPKGFTERIIEGWHFCLDPTHPEPIPPLMAPPIAGIPYEEALKIMARHKAELMALPGVGAVGLGATGIYIEAEDPSVLPTQVEGLPLEVHPWSGPMELNSHSLTNPIRPVHGALAVSAPNHTAYGTLTSVGLSCGMWLIFPTHLLSNCANPSPCTTATLQDCLNRYSQDLLLQPPGNTNQPVGHVVKWTPILPNATNVVDSAAAWADNDFNQGNSSLCVDRKIESWGDWTGNESTPAVGQIVEVISSNDPHLLPAQIDAVDVSRPNIIVEGCSGNPPGSTATYAHQVLYTGTQYSFIGGDSGSPAVTFGSDIVSMHLYSDRLNPFQGGGTLASTIRTTLGFTKWYGTVTIPNSSQVCQ